MSTNGKAGEMLKGSALEERINWLMDRIGKAGEHSKPNDVTGREFEQEILSYGEDAVIPLMRNLQYLPNNEKAVELLKKIEQEHSGALKRYIKILAELAKQHKVCAGEWSEKGVLNLLPLIEARLEPIDFKKKKLLTDTYLALFGSEESQLRPEYEKMDIPGKKEISVKELQEKAVAKLFAVILKRGGYKIEKQVAKKALAMMGPTTMPYILGKLENIGIPAIEVLHQIEVDNPGKIVQYGGVPAMAKALNWNGVEVARLLEFIGVPALKEILKKDEPGVWHATALAWIMRKDPQAAVSEIKNILVENRRAAKRLCACLAQPMNDEQLIEPLSLLLKIGTDEIALPSTNKLVKKGVDARLELANIQRVIEFAAMAFAPIDSEKTIPAMKRILDEGPDDARYFAALGLIRRGEIKLLESKLLDAALDKAVRNAALHAIAAETVLTKDDALRNEGMCILKQSPVEATEFIFWEAGDKSFSTADTGIMFEKRESAARVLVELGGNPLERLRLDSTEPSDQKVSVLALGLLISQENGLEGFAKKFGAKEADSLFARLVEFVESDNGAASEAGKLIAELGMPMVTRMLNRMESLDFNAGSSAIFALIIGTIIEKNPSRLDVPGTMPHLLSLLHKGGKQANVAKGLLVQIGEPTLLLLAAELETAYSAPLPQKDFDAIKNVTSSVAKTDEDVLTLGRHLLAGRYDAIADALALLVSKKDFSQHPAVLAQLPEHFKRVENADDSGSFANGSARIIFAINGPAIEIVADKLKAWNEDDVRIAERIRAKMYWGASEASKIRSRYLQIMAHFYISNPNDETANGFLPDFAKQVERFSFQSPERNMLNLGIPLHTVVVPMIVPKQFMKVTDVFIDAVAAAGENGIDALLEGAGKADAHGKMNIANALLEIKAQKPEMLQVILGKITPMAGSIVDLSFVLRPAVGPKADAIKEAACAIGLSAVEPICAAFGRGMPDWLEKFWMGVLSDIADKNKGAPELAPMIPLFSAKLEMPTLVNIGPAAVPFLLKEFEKDAKKAGEIGKIIDAIGALSENANNGVVAKPTKPEDMKNMLLGRALDVGVQAKPVMVKG